MEKIICKECNKKIDIIKKRCPNCGYKNKLDIQSYLEEDKGNNDICTNCGNKLNKQDSFCTNCGKKKSNFKSKLSKIKELIKIIYIRNKKITILVIILMLFILICSIYYSSFKNDMLKAEILYNNKEFYKAESIIKKYPIHFNNETYRKIESTKHLTFYYDELNEYKDDEEDYIRLIRDLLRGYERCDEELSTVQGEIEKQAIEDLKSLYRSELIYAFKLNEDDIKYLNSLESEDLEKELKKVAKDVIKSNTCELRNVDVLSYSKHGYKLNVKLKNNNGCTWNIKSYSEVRVYFTDGSYEDVYLGTNINLEADEIYSFYDCYLGSDNKYKTIRSVTFIN